MNGLFSKVPIRAAALVCFCFPSASVAGQSAAVTAGNVDGSAPRATAADAHVDLTGTWTGRGNMGAPQDPNNIRVGIQARGGDFTNFERDNTLLRRMDENRPWYKPQYWDIVQRLDQEGNGRDPVYTCMPAGVPRMGPPVKIVQTPTEMLFFYQNPDTYRIIPMDGRPHSPDDQLEGTWKGEPRGRWERDTFIVDTVGFLSSSWLGIGGWIHGDNMHVVEQFRRQGNTLTWQATVEDPDYFLKPWTMKPRTVRLNTDPKAELDESLPCSERDAAHLVTKEHH
jgi:hypothetical protein